MLVSSTIPFDLSMPDLKKRKKKKERTDFLLFIYKNA